MLATAVNAEYVEALGTLELTGDGYWQQGQRIVRGDRLFYDRTNQVFVSEGNSYLQVPVSEFGRQGKTNKSQLVQAESARFDYRNGYLSFYDKVRATLVETNTIRGRLFADDFVRIKGTNQVEQVRARGNVHGEQFTVPTLSGQMKSNKVDCEFLTVELETNGALRRVFADTNVVTQQFRVRSNKVSHTSLAAESLFADFFTHTNDIREAIAERNVVIISDDSTAKGQRATYSASNTVAELTGSPTLETARIKIDQADAIFYDRSTGKLSAGKPQGQARAPTNALKQAPLPGGGKL
jgi:lipopolysaccharide export system protein LptA